MSIFAVKWASTFSAYFFSGNYSDFFSGNNSWRKIVKPFNGSLCSDGTEVRPQKEPKTK
jgi:hypothetical protein